jgi:hypothetical protein
MPLVIGVLLLPNFFIFKHKKIIKTPYFKALKHKSIKMFQKIVSKKFDFKTKMLIFVQDQSIGQLCI